MNQRNMQGISEVDLVVPALRIANAKAGGRIYTSDLIPELEVIFNPAGKDAEIIPGRNDTYFSQKVRNLISHREGDGHFIAEGYAEYFSEGRGQGGIIITDRGRKLLSSIGG